MKLLKDPSQSRLRPQSVPLDGGLRARLMCRLKGWLHQPRRNFRRVQLRPPLRRQHVSVRRRMPQRTMA
jgi:hypothetical protein